MNGQCYAPGIHRMDAFTVPVRYNVLYIGEETHAGIDF
jgi:hypothetical protein